MQTTAGSSAGGRMTPANVAKDYEGLKGLTDVAVGCGFLAGAGATATLAPFGWLATFGPLVGVLVLTLVLAWAHRRYESTVGRATSTTFTGRSAVEVVGVLVGWAALLVATGIDIFESWPVILLPIAAAALILGVGVLSLRHVGLTPVHLVACGGLVLVGLMPLLAPVPEGLPRVLIGSVAVGLALVATGFTDHGRLMAAVRGRRGMGHGAEDGVVAP